MVSEAMAAYLRALKNKNDDLILIIDIDRKTNDGKPSRMAARWNTKNIYHYRCDDMREILARMLLIACNGDADTAIDLLCDYEEGALQWIAGFIEEDRQIELRKLEEAAWLEKRNKELNRIHQNKPKVIEDD